jgi:UDP-N-acetylglucosamine 2-epimerase (non-hydrolysing)
MKILVVFGTRPEAIKLAPVIAELRRRRELDVAVVTTAQHRELVDQVLHAFDIVPDADLDVMQPRQRLSELSGRVLAALDRLLDRQSTDLLIVQGDTTSAFMCGLAAFYRGIPIAHVEAGLRTASAVNPFPEEMNRRLLSVLASLHFAPTPRARDALLHEGVAADRVFVTGNTVVDALMQIRGSESFRAARSRLKFKSGRRRLLLVTLHRRESWGAPLEGMCRALRVVAETRPDVEVVLPVHLNPAVRHVVQDGLGDTPRISVIEPLEYVDFIALLDASWLVITDSGGVQEEAPTFGRPVLVLRDVTERPEAVEQGVAQLVGTDPDAIMEAILNLLDHPDERERMARAVNPFGDGRAAARIADIVVGHTHQPPRRRPSAVAPEPC